MPRKIRYTMDVTRPMHAEIEQMAKEAGVPKSEIFRTGIALLKVYYQAIRAGEHVGVGRDGTCSLRREFILPW